MKYFVIDEFTRSKTANEWNISNEPNALQRANIEKLVENVLDPLREWYGEPIRVNSGFRHKAVNYFVGGSPTSQHLSGEAADITISNTKKLPKLVNYIFENLDFDQMIYYKKQKFIHISYKNKGGNRHNYICK